MGFRKFIRYRIEAGKRGFFGCAAEEWQISFEPRGIVINHLDFRPFLAPGRSEQSVEWSDVEQVFAQQADNFTWDTVWLTFILKNGGSCSVPENAKGWGELLEQISTNLPNALPTTDWLSQVTRTAFAPNFIQLYPTTA